MVARNIYSRFLRQETGVTMIEALLTIPLVFLLMAGMIEVGTMMYQFSQTAKAMQVGARMAAVSSPAVSDMTWLTEDYPEDSDGTPVPAAFREVTCGPGAAGCDADALARIYDGGDGLCGATGDLSGICDVAPFISADNLVITYRRTGLGYVGRPRGPVVTVSVQVDGLNFDFFILDDLIRFFLPSSTFASSFEIPAQRVSMTSEDLSSCRGVCP